MEENHMGWKLVRGVRQDITNLFKLFANFNSVRYEDFCKIWKEMKFSEIFSCRTTFVELLEFTEELLQIVKEYLSSVYEFHTRVAALYTLYGLYFKQPIREAAKIRFTKTEWEEVNVLIGNCKEEKHYDVVFIHLKMYLSGAYIFTATVRPTGLERGFRKYSEKRCTSLPGNIDKELLLRPLISRDLVNSLIQLESLYCKKKEDLLGKKNLVFIDGKFARSLQEQLQSYFNDGAKEKNEETITKEVRKITESKSKGTKSKNNTEKNNLKINENQQDDTVEELKMRKRRKGTKYIDLVAKKKAEFYLKKLHEEYSQQEEGTSSQPKTFELPELDLN